MEVVHTKNCYKPFLDLIEAYTVRENHISLAVSEIFWDKPTDPVTFI